MKRVTAVLVGLFIFFSMCNCAHSKSVNSSDLSTAIRYYKAKNYMQCYELLNDIIKKDPSNAVAYYYIAMTYVHFGKKDEAISSYDKALSLSDKNTKLYDYAALGKKCLESYETCHEDGLSEADRAEKAFIYGKSTFSKEALGEHEKIRMDAMQKEINNGNSVDSKNFRGFKDFSSMNTDGATPSNDEIVAAMQVLKKAGFDSLLTNNNFANDFSLYSAGNPSQNAMLNMMLNNNSGQSVNPQMIQALLSNQLNIGF